MSTDTIWLLVAGILVAVLIIAGVIDCCAKSAAADKEHEEYLANLRKSNPYVVKKKDIHDWTEEIVEGRYMNHRDYYFLLEGPDGVAIKRKVCGSDYQIYDVGDKINI